MNTQGHATFSFHRTKPIQTATAAFAIIGAASGAWAQAGAGAAGSAQPGGTPTTSTAPSTSTATQSTAPSTSTPTTTSPTGSVVISGSLSTPPGPRHFDLTDTVSAAVQASAELANAERTVDIDKKKSDQAEAAGRPMADASGSATRFDAPTRVAFGGKPFTVLGNHTETLSLNLSDQLDLTGEIRAAASQEKLQSLADQMVAAQIRNARILLAKSVYYNLLRAEHQVDVAQSSLATAQQQQTNATELNQEQVGQKIDVLRANTQVATARQSVLSAQNSLKIAIENFDNAVGLPVSAQITVDDVQGVSVGTSITGAAQVGAPAPNIHMFSAPQDEIAGFDLTNSINTAYANRPEVLAAEIEVREAQTGIKIARAGLTPTFSIDAAGDYYPTTSFESPRQRVASITANLSVPLWDGGATRDRIAEAKLSTDNARTSLDSAKTNVALDVGQTYLNLTTAANEIDAANSALQEAIAARQLAEIRYEGQVGLYLEVTDAQTALVAAENSQVNAVYDYLVAKAQFENALGRPETH